MSKIEWTEKTWNPVVGCCKISPGCQNCYAERMALRLAYMEAALLEKHLNQQSVKNRKINYMPVVNFEKRRWNGEIFCDESALEIPLHWKKPRMIFVCSMSDLFHPKVPFGFIEKVMSVIEDCPQHYFQVLTKRPHVMFEYFNGLGRRFELTCLPNLWLGVTAENQEQADKRIPILLQIPAAVRFVSIEPMLGAIQLNKIHPLDGQHWMRSVEGYYKGLDQVIVGGESGPGARPMKPDNVRSIRDQCVAANVPFFFKSWGKYKPCDKDIDCRYCPYDTLRHSWSTNKEGCSLRVGKKKAGRLLDGREWNEYPRGK